MNKDILFNIMLHLDDASLRRLRVSNSYINNMINNILNDPYFWYIKETLETHVDLYRPKRERRFNKNYYNEDYDAYSTESYTDEDEYEEYDNYLDSFILPPREGRQYIYNKQIVDKNELDQELDDIEGDIINYYK